MCVFWRMCFECELRKVLCVCVRVCEPLCANVYSYRRLKCVEIFAAGVIFWTMFGGERQTAANITNTSEELQSVHRVVVMLLRMSVIDDYPYDTIRAIDELTGTILVLTFLVITALIGINLFIALLSDSFQR